MAQAAASTTKPATTKAAAPAKPAGAPKGPRGIPLDAKISMGKNADGVAYGPKNNPKRPDTKAAARFALYKEGQTVAKAIEAGMKPRHITRDVAKNYISVSGGTAVAE